MALQVEPRPSIVPKDVQWYPKRCGIRGSRRNTKISQLALEDAVVFSGSSLFEFCYLQLVHDLLTRAAGEDGNSKRQNEQYPQTKDGCDWSAFATILTS